MTTVASPAAREHVTDMTYPISPEYVKGWTSERGIAEFIANAIDADPTRYSVTYAGGVLTIEDFAVDGVGAEGMILGYTSKSNDSAAIGQFGEGAKIASLVLARDPNIKNVYVETVGYAFEPVITDYLAVAGLDIPNKTAAVPQVLTWRLFRSDRQRGTKVTIECPQAIATAAMDRFLHLSTPGYSAPQGEGRVIKTGEPGRFYIGGVYVTTGKGLAFSYDLSLASSKSFQNRDRSVIDSYRLQNAISAILRESMDVDVMATLMRRAMESGQGQRLAEAEQTFAYINANTPALRALWAKVREAVLGDRKVFYVDYDADNETVLDLVDRGFSQVRTPGVPAHTTRNLMNLLGVPTATSFAKKLRENRPETDWVKDSDLTIKERDRIARAVRLVRAVHGPESVDRVRIFTETRNAGVVCECGGFYSPTGKGDIAIRQDLIGSDSDVMYVLLHEAGHRIAHRYYRTVGLAGPDYNDRSRGFERTLVVMGQRMMDAFASGATVESLEAEQALVAAVPLATPTGMQVLPAGMRWNGNDRTAKPVPCTAEAAAALIRTAISAYGARNGIPDAKVPMALSKAPAFLSPALVRSLRDGKPNPMVKYVRMMEVVTALGMPPEAAAALWWGLVGGQGPYAYKTPRAKSHRFSSYLIPAAEAACSALTALGGEYADLATELLTLAYGKVKVDKDNADWQEPVVRLLALATAPTGTAAEAGA